jgi:hypothetical protein
VHASPSRLPARYRHRIDFLIIRKSEHFLIIRKLELCVERLSPTTKSNLRNIGRYIRNKESDGPPRPESWHSRSRGAFVISRRSPELHPVEGGGVFFITGRRWSCGAAADQSYCHRPSANMVAR